VLYKKNSNKKIKQNKLIHRVYFYEVLYLTLTEIQAVDKELEQFAEYDGDEKIKSIPPVKEPAGKSLSI